MVKNPIVAVVLSDVHLGALGSNKSQFNSLLTRLGKNPTLSLIVAGDFCDLMCESISQLNTTCQDVFNSLQVLQEKGVDICITLGNHEIPVLEPYEANPACLTGESYHTREVNLKTKLSLASHLQKVLPKIRFGQYAVLEKVGETWVVQMHNSIANIQLNPSSFHHTLIAHGFQFERNTASLSETWKTALESPDFLKDILDFFYNGWVKSVKDVFAPDKWKEGPGAVQTAIQSNEDFQKHPERSKSLIKAINEQPVEVQKFIQTYLQTMTARQYASPSIIFQDVRKILNEYRNLSGITHVLFGHTHQVEVAETPGSATIINTGAWQHVRKMTYIEVDNMGNMQVKHIRSKTYWIYVLIGLSLAIGSILGILWVIFHLP